MVNGLKNKIARLLLSDSAFNRVKIILSKQVDYHFLHVTKAGGKLFKSAYRMQQHENWGNILLHDHVTTINEIPHDRNVLIGLRDPIDRFVSGYHSPRRTFEKGLTELSPNLKKFYARYPQLDDLIDDINTLQYLPKVALQNQHLGIYRSVSYWVNSTPQFQRITYFDVDELVKHFGTARIDDRQNTTKSDYLLSERRREILRNFLMDEICLVNDIRSNSLKFCFT